eukprot:768128-Hanusia_phi.AAC.4
MTNRPQFCCAPSSAASRSHRSGILVFTSRPALRVKLAFLQHRSALVTANPHILAPPLHVFPPSLPPVLPPPCLDVSPPRPSSFSFSFSFPEPSRCGSFGVRTKPFCHVQLSSSSSPPSSSSSRSFYAPPPSLSSHPCGGGSKRHC